MNEQSSTGNVYGDGTYIRPDEDMDQPGRKAYKAAVAGSAWQQIHTDEQELNVQDWIEDYPELIVDRQFTWGSRAGMPASVTTPTSTRRSTCSPSTEK